MSVVDKILKAARYSQDASREHVTGGFERNPRYSSAEFSHQWLRSFLPITVSDIALNHALQVLIEDGRLIESPRRRHYRLADSTAKHRTIDVQIGVLFSHLDFHSGIKATARLLDVGESPRYEQGKLILDGTTYFQNRFQRELDGTMIRTDLVAPDYPTAQRMAQDFADRLLIAGRQIWFVPAGAPQAVGG